MFSSMALLIFSWCGGQADAMRGNIAAVPLPEESSEAGCGGGEAHCQGAKWAAVHDPPILRMRPKLMVTREEKTCLHFVE